MFHVRVRDIDELSVGRVGKWLLENFGQLSLVPLLHSTEPATVNQL